MGKVGACRCLMGLVPLAQNAGTGRVAAGQVLMYGQMGAYMCMDGCLYMHGRVLIYAWMGAYICMDSCLYSMDGCLAVIYRVSARYRFIHAKLNGPHSFADGLLLYISNGNRINAINSAPTGPSCTRTGIVYTLSFTSDF